MGKFFGGITGSVLKPSQSSRQGDGRARKCVQSVAVCLQTLVGVMAPWGLLSASTILWLLWLTWKGHTTSTRIRGGMERLFKPTLALDASR